MHRGSNAPVALRSSRRAMLDTLLRNLSMVRLSVGALPTMAIMVATAACTGSVTGGGLGGDDNTVTPEQLAARQSFDDEAMPAFQAAGCAGCHGITASTPYPYLVGSSNDDVYATIKASTVINVESPSISRVLTIGAHQGAAPLNSDQSTPILHWLQLEQTAANVDPGNMETRLETGKFQPLLCTQASCPTNSVALDSVGLAGARIEFIVEALASGIYVSDLSLVGSATDGAYVEHPLFVSWPAGDGDPVPDSIDRYFDTTVNVEPGMSTEIAGGTAVFIGFASTDKLSISFKVVEPYHPTDPGMTLGCQDLASFPANAKPQVQANCTGGACHTGNVQAKNNMDLTSLGVDDAEACKQVLSRVNKTTPDTSGVFLAPDPASGTGHPFKFGSGGAFTTYKNAMTTWIMAED